MFKQAWLMFPNPCHYVHGHIDHLSRDPCNVATWLSSSLWVYTMELWPSLAQKMSPVMLQVYILNSPQEINGLKACWPAGATADRYWTLRRLGLIKSYIIERHGYQEWWHLLLLYSLASWPPRGDQSAHMLPPWCLPLLCIQRHQLPMERNPKIEAKPFLF